MVLALMFLIGLAVAMQVQTVQALAPLLVARVGLSYAQIGVLTGLFMLPGVFLALPGGMLAARIGDRYTMAIALALMLVAAVAFSATSSFGVMVVTRLVGGAGTAVLTTQAMKVVTDWFAGREISTAMAVNAASFGLGVGVATGLLSGVAAVSSWQAAALTGAALLGVALVVLLTRYRDRPHAAQAARTHRLQLSLREFVLVLLAAIMRMWFAAGYVLFMSFAPVLLIARGTGVAQAGFLVSLSAVVALGSVPLGGVLADRARRPDLYIVTGALGAAASCLLLPLAGPALLWILSFGLLRGGCTGGIMALPSEVLRPGSRNAGFAVSSTVYFIGLSAVPPLAGWLLDSTRDPRAPLWLGVVTWLMIPLTLLVFRVLQRRWRQVR